MCSDRYKIIDVCVTAAVEWQIDFYYYYYYYYYYY